YHSLQPHSLADAVQLPTAHAVPRQIHRLKFDPPLFEPALRFFCIKALRSTKDLNIHSASLTMSGCERVRRVLRKGKRRSGNQGIGLGISLPWTALHHRIPTLRRVFL